MGTLYFEDLEEGMVTWNGECDVDKEEMIAYARQNDPWPFHVDEEAAAEGPFAGLIASGGYTISLMYRLGHPLLNESVENFAFLGGFDWQIKFPHPIRAGDHLRHKRTILSKITSSKPERGIVKTLLELINQEGRVVFSNEVTYLVATKP